MSPSVFDIRNEFIKYFVEKSHEHLKSSSLLPISDPSLMFTNAGMVQFKDVFAGKTSLPFKRATTAQKCLRAGGKHNDLENVGYTARHHTFFEMLGNFSFGDYFKEEAISLAWEFITKNLGIAKDKLLVTVHASDEEAAMLWKNISGLCEQKIIKIATNDNFWSMGEVGPCGPCSEIFYDHGENVKGGIPGSADQDGDRFIEIWNIVFMQFEMSAGGKLSQLPMKSIDTGMGLERLAAVLQGVDNNYDIDLFKTIKNDIKNITGKDEEKYSYNNNVIADHIRAVSFMIADGVVPASELQGYVLRRIIRRAIRHGYVMGMNEPFLYKLVDSVAKTMGEHYAELVSSGEYIKSVVLAEEENFMKTIGKGMSVLKNELRKIDVSSCLPKSDFVGKAVNLNQTQKSEVEKDEGELEKADEDCNVSKMFRNLVNLKKKVLNIFRLGDLEKPQTNSTKFVGEDESNCSLEKDNQSQEAQLVPEIVADSCCENANKCSNVFPAQIAYKLYDTYGFPFDLTQDIVRSDGLTVDEAEFEKILQAQKDESKKVWAGTGDSFVAKVWYDIKQDIKAVEFVRGTKELESEVLYIVKDSQFQASAVEKEEVFIVSRKTPFYAEAGGQIGDVGMMNDNVQVLDTQKIVDVIVHKCVVMSGKIHVGDKVVLRVDWETRQRVSKNHTATHILQKVLRTVLGKTVVQKGSLCTDKRLRFDFFCAEKIDSQQFAKIEKLVIEAIDAGFAVETKVMNIDAALEEGTLSLLGEKYPDDVRVVKIGDEFSKELCGGEHVANSWQIGCFKILSLTSIGSSIKRIECLTGQAVVEFLDAERLRDHEKICAKELAIKLLEKQILDLKTANISKETNLISVAVGDAEFRHAVLDNIAHKNVLGIIDSEKKHDDERCVVIFNKMSCEEASVCVFVSKKLVAKIDAVAVVNFVKNALNLDIKFGGRAGFVQCGKMSSDKIESFVEEAKKAIFSACQKGKENASE